MDTLQTYDELPYDSLPLPETQPDFLAAVAALHGYPAPPPHTARVLELGCAAGGNLIPLAFHYPESNYVGIELSRFQAEAGGRFIAALGINNARIVHADLAALPDDLGTFDYIIAHGVFSWVPPAVQQALLRVCRDHLSANGLAYVSFNVAAGWQELLPLRDALVTGSEASLPAPQRVEQARALLAELETQWSDPLLLQEIAHLKTAAPSYLFHEFLAAYNAPMQFADFAQQLYGAGLRYVGEAGPRRAVVALGSDFPPATLAARWMGAEAALDEAMHTRFRRALISRADAPSARPPQSAHLDGLMFYCDLTSDAEIDLDTADEQDFVNPAGGRFSIATPLLKAGVIAISTIYPAAMRYTEWLHAANELMTHFGATGSRDEVEFRDALFKLVTAQGVQMCVQSRQRATPLVDAMPQAHALARLQASTPGWVVSGVRHVALGLDDWGRSLLGMLDGTRNLEMLVYAMQAILQRDGVELTKEQIEALVRQKLDFFARQGLLRPLSPA